MDDGNVKKGVGFIENIALGPGKNKNRDKAPAGEAQLVQKDAEQKSPDKISSHKRQMPF